MEKIFKIRENGSTVKTEILAGISTFMTMAYIIALNPNLLTGFATGTPLWNAVFMATLISSAIGTFVMAFAANKPFVMAPGMGLNSFFAVVVANIAAVTGLSLEKKSARPAAADMTDAPTASGSASASEADEKPVRPVKKAAAGKSAGKGAKKPVSGKKSAGKTAPAKPKKKGTAGKAAK